MLCAAVALAASISGIGNGMVLDDAFMLDDPRMHSAARWGEIITQPYWAPPLQQDLYRPLASITWSVQYIIALGQPLLFRLVSYAFYCAAALTFLAFARRLLPGTVAAGIALLFAAHPVHVEAVAAAVSQNEMIVAMLTMGAVMFYRDRRTSSAGIRPRDWGVLALCYATAATFKEQGLLLPAFLLLTELLIPAATMRGRSLGRGYLALATVGVALVVIRIIVLREHAIAPAPTQGLRSTDLGIRVVNVFRLIPEWLRLLTWPQHLRIDYSPQEFTVAVGLNARERLGLGIALIVIAFAIGAWRRYPLVTFAFGWMALALLPVSNLVPTGILLAERTLFLPSVGFLLLVGAIAGTVLERWGSRPVRAVAALATAVLVLLGVWRSAMRHPVWASRVTLADAMEKESPRAWWAQWFVAQERMKQKRVGEARAAFERSVAVAVEPWWVRNDYAKAMRQIGDERTALAQLETSLKEYPRQKEAIFQYVAALIALGQYQLARNMAKHVLEFPDPPPQMFMLFAAAERALATNAPAGSIRLGVPKESGGPASDR
jgi:hypothetical protein